MQIIENITDLNKAIKNFNNVGFVPTMGGIHKGHLSLIRASQKKCQRTLVSIFVNPTQFNNKNDFKKYPRNIKYDLKILKRHKINYVFIPTSSEIFKKKSKIFKLLKKDKILCAKQRKGHFEGVLNVMNRLMSIIKSKHIFMGEKDFQQLYLLKKYLNKNSKIKFINCKTIRDKNEIALSTRNLLLDKKNYNKVSNLVRKILNFVKKFKTKNKIEKLYIHTKKRDLEDQFNIKFDYFEVRNEKNLLFSKTRHNSRLFIAYKINEIRLIDNFKL